MIRPDTPWVLLQLDRRRRPRRLGRLPAVAAAPSPWPARRTRPPMWPGPAAGRRTCSGESARRAGPVNRGSAARRGCGRTAGYTSRAIRAISVFTSSSVTVTSSCLGDLLEDEPELQLVGDLLRGRRTQLVDVRLDVASSACRAAAARPPAAARPARSAVRRSPAAGRASCVPAGTARPGPSWPAPRAARARFPAPAGSCAAPPPRRQSPRPSETPAAPRAPAASARAP